MWFVLAGLLLIPALAVTQDAQPGQDQGRRRGDPGQMRERMLNNIKEQMAVDEAQWKELAPKVEKVMTLQREARGGGMFGRGGDPGGAPESKVAQAQRDLRTALENKDTPAAEITQKLAAYREARDKARADLQAAQKDLKQGLNPRQEAALV
ncbi:MAG: hypothetical protein AB1716_25980, partial [Planctomycetota bacterium]